MKKFLLSGVAILALATAGRASAADFSIVPAPRWDGFYAGFNAGYNWTNNGVSVAGYPAPAWVGFLPTTAATSWRGATFGGQFGYQRQYGAFVLGFEADLDALTGKAAANTAGTVPAGALYTFAETQRLDSLFTLRSRVGYALSDNWLLYATGGLAAGHGGASTVLTFPPPTGNAIYAGSRSDLLVGWTIGGGVEYALNQNLSLKAEYLYYHLGHSTVVGLPNFPASYETHTSFAYDGQLVRIGLNYRFGDPLPPPGATSSGTSASGNFTYAFGTRNFMSWGRTQKRLFDSTGATMVSQLTYSGAASNSEELFGKIEHRSGIFLKGYAGLGSVFSGALKDEDFPPLTTPYSATTSGLQDGRLAYATADVGWDFLRMQRYSLGAFVGYNYVNEEFNADACAQTATNPGICVPSIASNTLIITNDGAWQSARLGLAGSVQLTNQLRWAGEAAWLPYTTLASTDTHWLRIQPIPGNFTGPIPETGVGHSGYQLDTKLVYALSPNLDIGVGVRWWHMQTAGLSHFDNHILGGGGVAQPVDFSDNRGGVYFQSAYRF